MFFVSTEQNFPRITLPSSSGMCYMIENMTGSEARLLAVGNNHGFYAVDARTSYFRRFLSKPERPTLETLAKRDNQIGSTSAARLVHPYFCEKVAQEAGHHELAGVLGCNNFCDTSSY